MDDIIIYNTEDGQVRIDLLVNSSSVWLDAKHMAMLFDTSRQNIEKHIKNIVSDGELNLSACSKAFSILSDGSQFNVVHYDLSMMLAVGFRVKSLRGVQFRKWANVCLGEYLEKGFIINDRRLKNPYHLTDHFDELLERIREIRASEARFYQKIRELFSLSADYDKTDKATQMFFAEAQNKLLYAVTKKTAPEIICSRADSAKPNMGLTSWSGSRVRKADIVIAKNYLTKEELEDLNTLVSIFLDTAELQLRRRDLFAMSFWQENLDTILSSNGFDILSSGGSISKKQMVNMVDGEYEKFSMERKKREEYEAELDDIRALELLKK